MQTIIIKLKQKIDLFLLKNTEFKNYIFSFMKIIRVIWLKCFSLFQVAVALFQFVSFTKMKI